MSVSDYLEGTLLDLVFNATAYAGQATVYVKLHTGDPGENGTSNAAGEATRAAVTFSAAVTGTVTSDTAASWSSVAASETYSYVSLWDAASGGNCLWTGPMTTTSTVTAGQNFRIPAGDLSVSLD